MDVVIHHHRRCGSTSHRPGRPQFDGCGERKRAGHRESARPFFVQGVHDRGVSLDSLDISASWAKLPGLYVAVRAALKQAMRNHAPRPGAHGLVLCHVGAARPDGAVLTFTWLFPRILDDAITQARNIRQAAQAAAPTEDNNELEQDVRRSIKRVLDPGAILNPDRP